MVSYLNGILPSKALNGWLLEILFYKKGIIVCLIYY